MKTTLLAVASLLLAGVSNTQTQTSLSAGIDGGELRSDFSQEMFHLRHSVRFQLRGEAAEWSRLLIDCDITAGAQSYPWLSERTTSNLGSIGDENGAFWTYSGPSSITGFMPNRLAHELGLGVREYGTSNESTRTVSDWYLPFNNSPGGTTRLWSSSAYWWNPAESALGGNGLGPANAHWWDGLNQHHYDGSIPSDTEFSLDALYRRYVLWRAVMTVHEHKMDPFEAANAFFNDTTVFNHSSAATYFRLHAVGIRLKGDGSIAGSGDPDAPRFGSPHYMRPIGRLTNPITFPIILPHQHAGGAWLASDVKGLGGDLKPGETRYFEAEGMRPPVRIEFCVGGGSAVVIARAAITRDKPLRMSVRVPDRAEVGPIKIKVGPSPWYTVANADSIQLP